MAENEVREHAGEAGPRVLVAVVSYRRPDQLRGLLPALLDQLDELSPPGTLLVVDNDPEGSARPVVEQAGSTRTVYEHEPSPGIAAARNRALDAARGHDVIVFVDDDETPSTTWLRELVDRYRSRRPAAVAGPVVSVFEEAPEPWVHASGMFEHPRHPDGAAVPYASTANLLLDLAVLREHDLRFDELCGLVGGSDMLLTRQLVAAGGRIVWCDAAEVTELVPAQRLQRRWVTARAFRHGNSWARTSLAVRRATTPALLLRLEWTARALVRMARGAVAMAVGTVRRSVPARALAWHSLAFGAGSLCGTYGLVYAEYLRSDRKLVRVSSLRRGLEPAPAPVAGR